MQVGSATIDVGPASEVTTSGDDQNGVSPSGGYAMFANAAMDVRFARGAFLETGPAFAWFRLRVPVVAGEEPGQPRRPLAVAAGSGG